MKTIIFFLTFFLLQSSSCDLEARRIIAKDGFRNVDRHECYLKEGQVPFLDMDIEDNFMCVLNVVVVMLLTSYVAMILTFPQNYKKK